MQGAAGYGNLETSLPFGGIIRIRFIGYDLNQATRPVPPLVIISFNLSFAISHAPVKNTFISRSKSILHEIIYPHLPSP